MPQGDKSAYTDKQKRKAEHIEEGYEKRGVSGKGSRAPRLGDGQQGRRRRQEIGVRPRRKTGNPAAHKGGKLGGEASASRPASERSASAKKAAETRKRNERRAS